MRFDNKWREEMISVAVVMLFVVGFFVLVSYDTNITGLTGFETEAVYFGTDVSSFFGSPLAPVNNTRTIDDRSIDFVFNASAEGIHNTSTKDDYCVGNWWFEQNGTNYADPTVNNGTYAGDASNTTGIVGYGVEFDGGGDYISIPSEPNFPDNFSLLVWIKQKEYIANQHLMAGSGNTKIFLSTTTNWVVRINGTSDSLTIDAIGNDWNHFAFTRNDTGNIIVYQNGVSKTTSDASTGHFNITEIGAYGGGLGGWNGTIDEVLIFNRTLSASEISAIYSDSISGGTSTVENCSLFLDIDNSGYGVNKTLTGTVAHNTSGISDYAVGNWWFEADSAEDQTGINNGTLVGVTNTTGMVGYGYEFDGINDYIKVEDHNTLTFTNGTDTNETNMTIMMWAYSDDWKGAGLISKTGEYLFNTASGGSIMMYLYDADGTFMYTPGTDLAPSYDGQWVHVAMTYNGSKGIHDTKLYLNGEDITPATSAVSGGNGIYNGMSNTANYVTIGIASSYMEGKIDEVMLFNRSLSAAEIKAIYEDGNQSMLNFEGYNSTITVDSFDFAQHDIDWKIGCYDSYGATYNSSEMQLELDALVTSSQPNIGAHAFVDENYVVGQWRFEEFNTTTFLDETGLNNGTISGGVKWCPDWGDSQKWNCSGRIGKGVHFDGDDVADTKITVANHNSLNFEDTTDFTISTWVKSDFVSNQRYILMKGTSTGAWYMMRTTATNELDCWIDDGVTGKLTTSVANIIDGNWHLATCVFDRDGNSYAYVDGVQSGTPTAINIVGNVSTTNDLWIGILNGITLPFNGTIDEVTIWNRSLSNEEVAQLYYSSAVSYNSTFTIQDISASNNHTCYDEETEVLTDEGWKFFKELEGNELVATLNTKTGEQEWQKPKAYQKYDYDGEMYDINLEDGSNLLVSPEHKVYGRLENKEDYSNSRSRSSLGDRTLSLDFCKPLSPEQIGNLVDKCKATYDSSFEWGADCLASGKNCIKSLAGINDISSIKNLYISSNSCSDNFDDLNILDLLFLTSSSKNSGAMNSNLFNKEFIINREKQVPLLISDDRTTFASMTNISNIIYLLENDLYNLLYLLVNDSLTSSASLLACDCVNLDLDTILFNSANLDSLSFKTLLINIDNSTLGINLNSDSNSFGISNMACVILLDDREREYLSVAEYELVRIKDVYSSFVSGEKELWFLGEGGNEIKVKSISKVPYSGKIYDVDVPVDDVILVRRKNENYKSQNQRFQDDVILVRRKNEDFVENGIDSVVTDGEYVTKKATIMGTVLGLDSGKDFDRFTESESGEFEGYSGASLKFGEKHVTIMGQGDHARYKGIWSGNSDKDNDTIKFIYDWYVNNESMAVLNMPFEAVNNGSEMNFSKDYSDRENHGSTQFNSDVFDGTSGWNRTGGYDGFGAYEFDGAGDYVTVADDTSLNVVKLTAMAWIYPRILSGTQGILNKRGSNGYALELSGFTLQATIRDATVIGSTTLTVNTWYHVALIYNRTSDNNITIYLNGKFEGTLSKLPGIYPFDSPLVIGDLTDNSGNPIGSNFNGTIDEVLIFNRSLSAEQIKAIYLNQTQTIKSSETVKGESWKAEVTANDGYGDSIEYNTSEIIIDDVTLTVKNVFPTNNYNAPGLAINFTYNVTDVGSIGGVINCSIWTWDGTNNWVLNSTKDYPVVEINQTFNLTFDGSASPVNWTITCYDKEHEQTNSSNFKVNLDQDPPAIQLQAPINNTNSSSSYVNFTYNATDAILGTDSCILWLYKSGAWELNLTDTSITQTVNQTLNITIEESSILWRVECNDTLNNRGNSTTYNITIDTSAPTINLQAPINDTTITCCSSVNITYNVSDSPTNIINCSLYLGYATSSANVINSSNLTITEYINQTFNLTFTVNDTWIYWKVGCYNDAEIQGNSSLRKFYLSSICPPPPPREPSPGSSSGMGSAGDRKSSVITEMKQTIGGNVYSIDKLLPGETELDLSDPGLSIVKIYLDSNREAENVELLIGETRNIRLEKPNRRVYRYVSIESNLPKSFVNKIRIIFRLHKNWGQDVKLLRYTSSWLELETNKIDEEYIANHNNLPNIEFDNEYYEYYEAISPGFSYFAITGEKISVILREEVKKVAQEVVEKPNKFEIWLYAMIPIIILVLVALILLYYLIKLIRKYRRITLSVVLLGLGIIILIIPFSDAVLYWAILPLSMIVLVFGGIGFSVWKILKRKKLKKER